MDVLLQPGELQAAGDLAAREAWIPLAALVILVFVRLLKSPRVPWPIDRIPAYYRPFLAIGLGIVASVLDRVINGTPWRAALVAGLASAAFAALTHDAAQGVQKGQQAKQEATSNDPEKPTP